MSEPDPQASILGNLPSRRPAVRSPRRDDPPAPEAAQSAGAGTDAAAVAADLADPGLPGPEGLARSGFAVAGGLAALGARVAEEAVAAVRGAIDRR